jgi:hypothetical protein
MEITVIAHSARRLFAVLPLFVVAASSVVHAQAPVANTSAASAVLPGAPAIIIESPTMGATVNGVAIIRFKAENVSIASLFVPLDPTRGPLPAAHLHVTVDGTVWHWVHSSTDPVVITPLSAGEHTVTLELAGADHKPLNSKTVRFTVVAKVGHAAGHGVHR